MNIFVFPVPQACDCDNDVYKKLLYNSVTCRSLRELSGADQSTSNEFTSALSLLMASHSLHRGLPLADTSRHYCGQPGDTGRDVTLNIQPMIDAHRVCTLQALG